MRFKVIEKYETVIDAPSLEQAQQMYANDEIYISDTDYAGVEIYEEGKEKMEKTIEISTERYVELLRKEMGFEYRKAELEEKEAVWINTADKIIFGVTGKTPEPPKCEDDDF